MNKTRMGALLSALLAVGAQAQPALELEDAWVRALPPTQPTTAAYLRVRNPGASAQVITGASVELAGKVEIHTTRTEDGYTGMQQLESLQVPAGGELQLAPGGTHLMLLELARMPAAGETLPLCLQLAGGSEICTAAEVRRDAGNGASHHHHH